MKKAVIYGAGNIGRGFLGQIFHMSGYSISFIDVNKSVVDRLNAEGHYPIYIAEKEGYQAYTVTHVSGVDGSDMDQVAETIASADVMATAVGVNVLPCIAEHLAAGIQRRMEKGIHTPLNIIVCENMIGVDRYLAELIKKKLLSGGLLSDAVVTVEFMNFKVSVLGEVTSPGTYVIEGDKVTILQAISLARDLTIFGQRKNVSVIRERDGQRTIYQVDLTNVDLFKSPAYYLQQNDIVYVEPNEERARQSTVDDKGLRLTSIAVSSASVLLSLTSLIINLIN